MKRILSLLLTFVILSGMVACGNGNEDKESEFNNDEETNRTSLHYSVISRISSAVFNEETNILEKLGKDADLSKVQAGNMIPIYILKNNSFIKQAESYIPFFYDDKPVIALSTQLKTEYTFGYENIMDLLDQSGFEQTVMIVDREKAYLCNGQKVVVLWNLNQVIEDRGVLLDGNGRITSDTNDLEFCDLSIRYSLVQP